MFMHRRCFITAAMAMLIGGAGTRSEAAPENWTFPSIDGGTLSFDAWKGRPILVANTASRCGFTHQYDALQDLYDAYRDQGLVVLAVPSDDFRQELASNEDVKEFCEVNFNLTLPMSTITPILGANAHPFYAWVKQTAGWVPSWNFNKVLISPDGQVAGTWRSTTSPTSRDIRKSIEAFL